MCQGESSQCLEKVFVETKCHAHIAVLKSFFEKLDRNCEENPLDMESVVILVGGRLFLRKLSRSCPAFRSVENNILQSLTLSTADLTKRLAVNQEWPEVIKHYSFALLQNDPEGVGLLMFQDMCIAGLKSALELRDLELERGTEGK